MAGGTSDWDAPDGDERDEWDDTTPDGDEAGRDVPGLPWWQRLGYGVADRLQAVTPRRWWDAFVEPAKPATPDLTPYTTGVDDVPATPMPDEWDVHTSATLHDWPVDQPVEHGPADRPAGDYRWPGQADTAPAEPSHPSPHVSPHPGEQHEQHQEPITGSATMAVDASHYTGTIDLSTPETRFSSCMDAAGRARTDADRCDREAQEFFDEAAKLDTVPGSETESARLRREGEALKEDRDRRRAIAAGLEKRAGAAPQPVAAGATR
jgi:hypothetical protein